MDEPEVIVMPEPECCEGCGRPMESAPPPLLFIRVCGPCLSEAMAFFGRQSEADVAWAAAK